MADKAEIAILYHIFYEDSYEKVCMELAPFLLYNAQFFFNICEETPGKKIIACSLKKYFPECFIIYTSNKGKDIGAKLALIKLCLALNISFTYFIFLHDKKSLQALKSNTWKKDLLKIISKTNIDKILIAFKENNSNGIIGTTEYIISEPFENGKFTGINGNILSKLITKYKIQPTTYLFVAGTMFWTKAKPIMDFFKNYNPLEIRMDLEDGNVLDNFNGTTTHAWERLLSWIVTNQGLTIKGI